MLSALFALAFLSLLAAPPVHALAPQPEAYCMAVADSGDNLVFHNKDGDGFVNQGGTGTGAIEATAFNPGVSACDTAADNRADSAGCLYATDGDNFGFIDYDDSWDTDGNDSEFIQVVGDVGDCDSNGDGTDDINISDVDGLQFDLTRTDASTGTFVLWATEREGGNDLIFQIDPATGLVDTTPTPGFAGGATCVRMTGTGTLGDLDDIAVDPIDGTIYAVNNAGGTIDLLVTLDPVTGAASIIGNFFNPLVQVQDMEGLSFGADGQLYGTTGTSDEFFEIDKSNAFARPILAYPSLSDYEAISCLTDNLITGTVFFDVDGDGVEEPADGDAGFQAARVLIYLDNNNNNIVDGGDTLFCDNSAGGFNLECPITDVNGFYDFTVGQGNFVAEVDTATLPTGHLLTTDNDEEADFANTDFGQVDPDNDFGFTMPPGAADLEITKTSDAGGPVVQGQTITYTIDVTNNSGVTHKNIRLTDSLPPGVTYDPQSTVVTGPISQLFQTLDEFGAVSYANNDGRDPWAGNWVETDLDGGGGPAGGEILVTGGELSITNNVGGNLPFIDRGVDLSAFAGAPSGGALLRFDFRTTAGLDATDAIAIEAWNGIGAPVYTVIETITNLVGTQVGQRTVDLSPFISPAPFVPRVRFRVSAFYGGANEFFLADNIEVLAGDNYRDTLDTAAVNRQDGSLNWTTNWFELGESDGPGADDAQIGIAFGGRNAMRVRDNDGGGVGWEREADLSTAESAILTFLFRRDALDGASDYVTIDVSRNGGASWTELARLDGGSGNDAVYVPGALDISAFAATNTRIRFLGSPTLGGGDSVYFDDVNILLPQVAIVTKDNIPAGVNADLLDGVPPDLVEVGDEYILRDGDTLTATLRVVVDNPLDPYLTDLLNTAVVTSNLAAASAFHNDPVVSGTVGDRVWLDTDRDGVQDIGEPGIPNVEVSLRVDDDGTPGPSAGDSVYGTRITGMDGEYLFDHLPPGTYWVDVTDATVPAGLEQSPGNIDPPIDPIGTAPTYAVATNEVFLTADFGYTTPAGTAIIGDRVWSDSDNDGIQDPGEIGIGGVTLDLIGPGADGILGTADDVAVDTVTTNADGTYLFTGVAPGEYIVDVTDTLSALTGYTLTTGPQSNPDPSEPVLVFANDIVTDIDFGYNRTVPLFTISDRLWLDSDSDGTQDAGEDGLAGVTVSLLNSSNEVIGTAITDANGDFSFTDLPNGDYTIQITDTSGELNGLGGTTTPAQDTNLAVTIAGANVSGVNFGYNAPASLGDRIWSDSDGDGVQDVGELGIEGVLLNLLDGLGNPVLDSGNNPIVTTTGPDGSYLFAGLIPGDYQVEVDASNFNALQPLDGYSQTGDPDEAGTCVTCDDTGSSTLALGESDLTLDFGYQNTALANISGNVFLDLDIDGFDDGVSEPGFLGVTLDLLDASGNVIATTTTDANGDYSFEDLPAGDYTVKVTDAALVLDGYTLTSGLDEIDVTVAGTDITGIDFGYIRMSGAGSIGDTIWLDSNGDGVQGPSEAGLSGVFVELYLDSNGDGVFNAGDMLVSTTVTDADGRYVFPDLAPGFYFVDPDETTLPETTAGDLVETTYPAGVDPSAVIALSEGENFVEADFGYVPASGTASIGDRVWHDLNGDGLQDDGEIGIAGVDVVVYGPNCSPCTVTTGPDGIWLLTGLDPGDYFVSVDTSTLPAGVNTTPTNLAPDDTYSVTVAAGDAFVHLDFGYDGGTFGSVGDLVWFDTDGDGNVDGGELGVEGVTVNLIHDTNGDGAWDPDGLDNIFGNSDDEAILDTVTTDDSGAYLFTGLPDDDYLVDVTDIDDALVGLQKTVGIADVNNNSQADPYDVTIAAAANVLTADFGYTAEGEFGSISNFVWRDLNADGDVDPGEPGIQGVTLELWLDDGDGTFEPFSGEDNLVRIATTDANGEYEFKSLPFGDYFVDLTDENGVLAGLTKTVGAAPGMDNNSQADPYAVILNGAGPNNVTADFGYEDAVGPMSISGSVFTDADIDAALDFTDLDGDTVYDPAISPDGPDTATETLVAGVRVNLYRIVGGSRFLVDSTTTDATGFYTFDDLPAGDYEVDVDPAGTTVDGFPQTTQSGTGGVQPVTLADNGDMDWTQPNTRDSRNNNFGFWDGGITTTPVTLAYFEADAGGTFRWMTSTEVGNLGFNLYAITERGVEKLNEELIESHVVDSLEPQVYEFDAGSVAGATFLLEDVDIHGLVRHHGPFYAGEARGTEVDKIKRVSWTKIRDKKEEVSRRRAEERRAAEDQAALLEAERPSVGIAVGAVRAGGRKGCLSCRPRRKAQYESASLGVDRAGIYRVSYEALAAAGVDLAGARSSWLALTAAGQPTPVYVSSGPTFGPGSFIEFVGEPVDTLYTKTNVYRLSVDRRKALRVEERPFEGGGLPEAFYLETSKVETQAKYHFASPTDDPWYHKRLLATSGPKEATVSFDLDGWAAGAAPVSMQVSVWGGTDFPTAPDHHLVIDINGSQTGESWFDGLEVPEITFDVADSQLTTVGNTMTLKLPHDTGAAYDLVNYDSMTIDYPRAFVARSDALEFSSAGSSFTVQGFGDGDVAAYRLDNGGLVRLGVQSANQAGGSGLFEASFGGGSAFGDSARYWVASNAGVLAPTVSVARSRELPRANEADVLVVAHEHFLDGLAPWVARRESEGLSVQVVDVADLYEVFSHGVTDPEAIRQYVRKAASGLGVRYLLLVGGDTYDYFDYLGVGSLSFIPSLYQQTDAIVRYAPVDPLYGDIDDDLVPDLAVGRWPVRTVEELATVIDKTLAYSNSGNELSAVMASDGVDLASGYSFSRDSAAMAAALGSSWQVDSVSLDDMTVADARDALISGISAGPALTSYFGHSSYSVWSFDGLFASADVAELTNSGDPTIVTQWGCWNTYHVLPTFETLGNQLLLTPDTGAAAVLGASTLTEALSERLLGSRVFERIAQPGQRLGDSITGAKQDLAETAPGKLDVILGWTLLGDPTLTVVP